MRSPNSSAAQDTASGGRGRLVLLGLVAVAVAYVSHRYLDSSVAETVRHRLQGRAPAVNDLQEQTPAVVSDRFQEIPIGDSNGEADTMSETASAETAAPADAVVEDSEMAVDLTEEDRSPDEIEERAAETSPEPGEMAADEEIADELLEGHDGEDTTDGDTATDDGDEQDHERN